MARKAKGRIHIKASRIPPNCLVPTQSKVQSSAKEPVPSSQACVIHRHCHDVMAIHSLWPGILSTSKYVLGTCYVLEISCVKSIDTGDELTGLSRETDPEGEITRIWLIWLWRPGCSTIGRLQTGDPGETMGPSSPRQEKTGVPSLTVRQ